MELTTMAQEVNSMYKGIYNNYGRLTSSSYDCMRHKPSYSDVYYSWVFPYTIDK